MIKEFTVESKRVKNYQTMSVSLTCDIPIDIGKKEELDTYIKEMQDYTNKLAEEQLNKVTK